MARSTGNTESSNTIQERNLQLWYNKLGHANLESIKSLYRNGSVTIMDVNKPGLKEVCESCMEGKQTRQYPRTNTHRTMERGTIIHSDLCGPMSTPSFSGCLYFVTFNEEGTGYITVYHMVRNSDVISKFKIFKPWLEHKFSCSIKRLNTNGRGEYIGMKAYLEERGIKHHMAPRYSNLTALRKEQTALLSKVQEQCWSMHHNQEIFGLKQYLMLPTIAKNLLSKGQD